MLVCHQVLYFLHDFMDVFFCFRLLCHHIWFFWWFILFLKSIFNVICIIIHVYWIFLIHKHIFGTKGDLIIKLKSRKYWESATKCMVFIMRWFKYWSNCKVMEFVFIIVIKWQIHVSWSLCHRSLLKTT